MKIPDKAYFCLLGKFNLQTIGIGTAQIATSVKITSAPAASQNACSFS
jgi:hypothetical protein